MVAVTIHTVDPGVPVTLVHASRGKQTRAEPVSALYEQGRGHHVGHFPALEDEMCLWLPGDASPNRMDALVWALTRLMIGHGRLEVGTIEDFGQPKEKPKEESQEELANRLWEAEEAWT